MANLIVINSGITSSYSSEKGCTIFKISYRETQGVTENDRPLATKIFYTDCSDNVTSFDFQGQIIYSEGKYQADFNICAKYVHELDLSEASRDTYTLNIEDTNESCDSHPVIPSRSSSVSSSEPEHSSEQPSGPSEPSEPSYDDPRDDWDDYYSITGEAINEKTVFEIGPNQSSLYMARYVDNTKSATLRYRNADNELVEFSFKEPNETNQLFYFCARMILDFENLTLTEMRTICQKYQP